MFLQVYVHSQGAEHLTWICQPDELAKNVSKDLDVYYTMYVSITVKITLVTYMYTENMYMNITMGLTPLTDV